MGARRATHQQNSTRTEKSQYPVDNLGDCEPRRIWRTGGRLQPAAQPREGREKRHSGWRPRAPRRPPAGAAGAGGRQGRAHGHHSSQNKTTHKGGAAFQRAASAHTGSPITPPLWESPAFADWGDPTTEAAKAPEATQATRSSRVKAAPSRGACFSLDAAATLRRGAVCKSSCFGTRAARAPPLCGGAAQKRRDAYAARLGRHTLEPEPDCGEALAGVGARIAQREPPGPRAAPALPRRRRRLRPAHWD